MLGNNNTSACWKKEISCFSETLISLPMLTKLMSSRIFLGRFKKTLLIKSSLFRGSLVPTVITKHFDSKSKSDIMSLEIGFL